MGKRRSLALALIAALASLGASYPTQNFLVEAPTPEIAQKVGQAAEYYRREKALEWLGHEMPPWPERCPLKVKVTIGGAGGATSFAFDRGRVLGQSMTIEGPLDRLLVSVLPHEVTHTVFAFRFRRPLPRWADEGGAVLSEDDQERGKHDMLARQILRAGRAFPLRRLFSLRDYPSEVMTLYAQGYSVAQFLVSSSSKQAFLAFVDQGTRDGWDAAVQAHYRYRNVEELEQGWLNHLRQTRNQPTLLARNPAPAAPVSAPRTVVRLTAPPVQPLEEMPPLIVRGQSEEGQPGPQAHVGGRTAVPENVQPASGFQDGWRPRRYGPAERQEQQPAVRLGIPQFGPTPAPTPPSPRRTPGAGSPVGYPYD
jgi:hypothetical protein